VATNLTSAALNKCFIARMFSEGAELWVYLVAPDKKLSLCFVLWLWAGLLKNYRFDFGADLQSAMLENFKLAWTP